MVCHKGLRRPIIVSGFVCPVVYFLGPTVRQMSRSHCTQINSAPEVSGAFFTDQRWKCTDEGEKRISSRQPAIMIPDFLKGGMGMQAIKTVRLTKKYKSLTAVDSLDLEIGQGELFCLLGVNGAGKTTTIKMLSCLTRPTSGEAYVGGISIKEAAVKNMIGVSPQETAVAPNLSVKENLELICGIHGFSKEKTSEMIRQLSAQLGLEGILCKKAGKLSGGWQRRVSIAMALISQPQVLFLDEPTLGLDVIARSELWDTIRSVKGNITIILTTHYMEEAEALSDRIGIMKNGRLLALGTAAELMAQTSADRFENAFISIVKGAGV